MEYPWYELIDNCDEITQGDIVMQCPVPIIKTDNEVISGSTISADDKIIDGIILTQACDIANRKIDNIILCSITSKDTFETQMRSHKKAKKRLKSGLTVLSRGRKTHTTLLTTISPKASSRIIASSILRTFSAFL